MIKCPLHLQVRESVHIWNTMHTQYQKSREIDRLSDFKHTCMIQAANRECRLLDFLVTNEREFSDDIEIQQQFKMMADDHIIYDYFSKVTK